MNHQPRYCLCTTDLCNSAEFSEALVTRCKSSPSMCPSKYALKMLNNNACCPNIQNHNILHNHSHNTSTSCTS